MAYCNFCGLVELQTKQEKKDKVCMMCKPEIDYYANILRYD